MRNAPEGRATISFSKLRHSWGALASTRAWDVSGRTPVCTRVRRPLRGAVATSLPPSAGERKWGTRGRGDSKAAHSDRVHSATSSHVQPAERSGCRPRGWCCPLHPGHSQGDTGDPGADLTAPRGWKCPGASLQRAAGGDATSTPSFPPRLRPHLPVSSREAGSARSRALPVAALGNPVGPGQT